MSPLSPEVLRFAMFLLNFISQDLSNHLADIEGDQDSQLIDPVDDSPTVDNELSLKSRCGLSNERYYAGNGQCYKLNTQGPCPRNQLFIDNSNGGGTCNCPNWNDLYFSETRKCYKRNSQGPCNEGEWLTVEEGSSDGSTPVCEPIPEGCIADGRHIYMLVSDPELGERNERECMKLGTQGPCADDEVLYRLDKSDQIICRKNKASGNKVSQVQDLLEKIWTEANGQIHARALNCKPGQVCRPMSTGIGFG